jgi:hypothetical protein
MRVHLAAATAALVTADLLVPLPPLAALSTYNRSAPLAPLPSQCGTGASCKPICGWSGQGICTYDDDSWKTLRSAENPTHYGDPKNNGCKSDETALDLTGIPGKICGFNSCDKQACPTDVPAGVTAIPQCDVNQKASKTPTECALVCTDTPFTPCCDSAGTKVAQGECDSWIDMFDKTGGTNWAECSDARQNPCDCNLVTCSAGTVSHIEEM